MVLGYGFDIFLSKAENIFDLIGNCFGVLCDNVVNHQAFISHYIDRGGGTFYNPNIPLLNKFSGQVMELMQEFPGSRYVLIQQELLSMINNLELQDYMEPKQNHLTIIFCILSSIDSVSANWDRKWISGTLGPLDRQPMTNYRVYFNVKRTIHTDYINGMTRKRAVSSNFFEQFENFRFINETHWKEHIAVPQIKCLPLNRTQVKRYENIHKLRIAVIPVSCKKNLRTQSSVGSSFVIDYSQHSQTCFSQQIVQSVESAISMKSNLIVLPEFTVSPEIYTSIKNQIKMIRKKQKSLTDLMLVFAGSTWTEDNNNVMRILDSWGEEVGEYYKYTPYTKRKKGKCGFEECEDLRTPGKCCDVLAIEGIGLFLPAICRDMIDGEYTLELAKILLPAFTIISAWSSSVASFVPRQKELANRYFVSSVLANACASVDKRTLRIGNGSIVHKSGTIAGEDIRDIERDNCISKCMSEGCFYILDYDFSYEEGKQNTNLEIFRQKLG